jgi:hypothetical protein
MPAKKGHRYAPYFRQATAVILADRLPGLDVNTALDLLQRSRAWNSHALLDLHDHLLAQPDALTTGNSKCPAALIRLVHALLAAGRDDVVAPTCVACGRTPPELPGLRDTGRVCLACYRRDHKQPCARCARITRAAHRRPEGLICTSCRDAEPTSQGVCPGCGHTRPLREGPDGAMRCDGCRPRPKRACASCGRITTARKFTDQGRLCRRCYPQPGRVCGGCQQLRVIQVKATNDHPDLCQACRPRTIGTCAGCGRHTFGNRSDRGRGRLLCQTCQPKIHRTCSRCGSNRPAHAFWPIGPVCKSCYAAAKRHPAACSHCAHTRVLIGINAESGPICGPCAGTTIDYLCHRCGLGDQPPWHDGRCARCALADTVTELFGDDPHTPLRPVADSLLAQPDPALVLHWLAHAATAKLLAALAATAEPITHHTLDQLGGSNEVHLLRHMLVAATVLPERVEHLDRITPWLDEHLRWRPAARSRLIRPFVQWTLIHRARRNAATRGFSPHAADHLRGRILAILELLDWLDERGTTLRTATQTDIDAWMDSGPTYRRTRVAAFLTWARKHHHAGDIAIPVAPRAEPRLQPLTDDDVRHQLKRCLHDDSLPRDVRLAGALILLFGTTTARLVRLHTNAVTTSNNGQVRLHLGRTPLTLPPPLDDIAVAQAVAPLRPRGPVASLARTALLFPGRAPDQAISARSLRDKLRRHGVAPVPGRHAAIIAMTADLPAPVLADLLGIAPKTADRWANAVNTDWTHYLAARDQTPATSIGGAE